MHVTIHCIINFVEVRVGKQQKPRDVCAFDLLREKNGLGSLEDGNLLIFTEVVQVDGELLRAETAAECHARIGQDLALLVMRVFAEELWLEVAVEHARFLTGVL